MFWYGALEINKQLQHVTSCKYGALEINKQLLNVTLYRQDALEINKQFQCVSLCRQDVEINQQLQHMLLYPPTQWPQRMKYLTPATQALRVANHRPGAQL